MDYNNVEKARCLMKMEWEGGLLGFMNYGLPRRLYLKFKDELEDIYDSIEKKKTKKEKTLFQTKVNALECKITEYLKTDEEFTDNELNDVNYIFTERGDFNNV